LRPAAEGEGGSYCAAPLPFEDDAPAAPQYQPAQHIFAPRRLPLDRRLLLEAALGLLLRRGGPQGSGSASRRSGRDSGRGAPAPEEPPQVVLLAPVAGAEGAARFCAALPQLRGRVAVSSLNAASAAPAAAPPGAGGGAQQEQAHAGGQAQQEPPLQEELRLTESGQRREQQQQAALQQHPEPKATRDAPPPSVIVLPQQLLLTQLAVVVRRHLVGRRSAKVIVEFRWGFRGQRSYF
jgi:hypothetical protein